MLTPSPPILAPDSFAVKDSTSPPPARWRLVAALILLGTYVLLPAVLGLASKSSEESILPGTVRGVLILCGVELSMFSVAFGAAAVLARFRSSELLLAWPHRWWIWPRAVAWSVALRVGVGILLVGSLAVLQFLRGESLSDLDTVRPKIEAMVDVAALQNPVYLLLMLTVVSFVLAGLREELWRIGMVALLGRLMPAWFGGRLGPWLALVPVAILFGLGHTPQGWVGVAATTVLGLGLGAIMLFHRSLWDAVLAHGFFNATTFALLPWIAHLIPQLQQQ